MTREGGSVLAAEAVGQARAVQGKWAALPLKERLQVIRRFRHLLAHHALELAQGASRHGACDSKGSLRTAEVLSSELLPLADACRFLERQAPRVLAARRLGLKGRPLWLWGVRSEVRRESYGVVLLIAPANYPILLPGVQLLQALAAGNAVLLKPGTNGTGAALSLAQLLWEAGLPPGLVRVLDEHPKAAQAAIEKRVDKVIFTGSAAIGAQVLAEASSQLIPATMELSGCDAVFVRADADLDLAARALAFGLRLNAGQTCIAPKRVFVDRAVATQFEASLVRALSRELDFLVKDARSARLAAPVAEALAAGARLLRGRFHPDGSFSAPLVLADVPAGSALLREDFFAPVATLVSTEHEDEALELAKACPYALGATVFGRNVQAAKALARHIPAGEVVINDMIVPTADARLPFGGRGLSGFGTTRGREGLLEMTIPKVVMLRRGWRPHLETAQPADAELFNSFLVAAHGKGWRTRVGALQTLIRNVRNRAAGRGQVVFGVLDMESRGQAVSAPKRQLKQERSKFI